MNKVILIGNLGGDPKISYAENNGMVITKFSIATNERWKDKISGEMHEHTEWHNITAFGTVIDIIYKNSQFKRFDAGTKSKIN